MKVAARRGPLPKEARLAQGFAVLPPQRSTFSYANALLPLPLSPLLLLLKSHLAILDTGLFQQVTR